LRRCNSEAVATRLYAAAAKCAAFLAAFPRTAPIALLGPDALGSLGSQAAALSDELGLSPGSTAAAPRGASGAGAAAAAAAAGGVRRAADGLAAALAALERMEDEGVAAAAAAAAGAPHLTNQLSAQLSLGLGSPMPHMPWTDKGKAIE
jgi:hypothetical protein